MSKCWISCSTTAIITFNQIKKPIQSWRTGIFISFYKLHNHLVIFTSSHNSNFYHLSAEIVLQGMLLSLFRLCFHSFEARCTIPTWVIKYLLQSSLHHWKRKVLPQANQQLLCWPDIFTNLSTLWAQAHTLNIMSEASWYGIVMEGGIRGIELTDCTHQATLAIICSLKTKIII